MPKSGWKSAVETLHLTVRLQMVCRGEHVLYADDAEYVLKELRSELIPII